MRNKTLLRGFFLGITTLLLSTVNGLAATRTVCADGCGYTTISSALTAAMGGGSEDVIHVQSGYDPATEVYSLGFPNASTTLMCDPGVSIGQTSPTGANAAYLSTSSTVIGCAFGNINLRSVSLGPDPVSGIRIINNTFSASVTGTIDFIYGGTNFEISGNTNISHLNLGATSTNGLVQNNTFYGWMSGRYSATMLLTHASSSNLRILNNTFTSYATVSNGSGWLLQISGYDQVFATNTVKYAADFVADVAGSVVFSASGTNYIAGNFIESPSEESTCSGLKIFAERNQPWTATYNIYRNTIINRGNCFAGSAIAYSDNWNSASIIPTINASYNLLFNAVSSTPSDKYGIHLSLQGSSVMNQANQYNGAYGYAGVVATKTGGGSATNVSDATSRTAYPHLKRSDASSSNDLETAPFSSYLDVNGAVDIGATSASRRATIYLDDNGAIDYSAVDATSTHDITSIVRTGDSFVLAAGTYERINVSSTYATSSFSFTGAGASTIVNAGTNQDAITITNATSVVISSMKVQGATSAGSVAYSTTRINLSYASNDYSDMNGGAEIASGDMIVAINPGTCDISQVTSDGVSLASVPGIGSSNMHIALVTLNMGGSSRHTMLVSNALASSGAALNAAFDAGCGPGTIVTDLFISNVFTLSGSAYSYQASAVSGATASLVAGVTSPPAISSAVTNYGGIKLTNVNNSVFSSVTSTGNRYGIIFDANSGGNTVSNSEFLLNTSYDVSSAGYATNTFDNVSFTRASSTVSGAGPLLVKYKVRAQTLRSTNSAAVSGASVTLTDASSQNTSLGSTNGSGYTSFTSVPAYRITASSNALTNGGFNPGTLSTAISGYAASSTAVTLSSVNTTVALYITPTSTPAAPSSPTVSIGTTTSTLSWTDNADDEGSFIINLINLSTGESFPGTVSTAVADATSDSFSGLTPNMTYMARVQATTTAYGGSAHATSSAFTTKAAVPSAPSVTAASRTSVQVVIDAGSNSTSTQYAIYSSALGGYISALGAVSASPTWQTTSTWSTLTVSDLTCNTTYGFSIIARNLNLVLTATSTASSVTTSACASSGSSGGSSGGGGGGGTGAGSSVGTPALFSFTPSAPVTPLPISTPAPSTPASPPSAPVVDPAASGDNPMARNPSASSILRIERDARQFRVELEESQEESLARFVEFGTGEASRRLGAGERAAIIRDLMQTLGPRVRALSSDDPERVASGQIPRTRNLKLERGQLARARQTFRTIYGDDPNFQNAEENLAWNTLMYRIRFSRDMVAERQGIQEFRRLFGRSPQDPFQWSTVRVLGYVNR